MRYTIYINPGKKSGIVRDYSNEEELKKYVKALLQTFSYLSVVDSNQKEIMKFGKEK